MNITAKKPRAPRIKKRNLGVLCALCDSVVRWIIYRKEAKEQRVIGNRHILCVLCDSAVRFQLTYFLDLFHEDGAQHEIDNRHQEDDGVTQVGDVLCCADALEVIQ